MRSLAQTLILIFKRGVMMEREMKEKALTHIVGLLQRRRRERRVQGAVCAASLKNTSANPGAGTFTERVLAVD
jgi:hypothetical protein